MVGFIAGDIRDHQKVSWIATIGVLPEYRGRGLGSQLLEACEKLLPSTSIKLCVRISNESAIRMYRKFGYNVANTWQRYYQDGEDALVMEKIRL